MTKSTISFLGVIGFLLTARDARADLPVINVSAYVDASSVYSVTGVAWSPYYQAPIIAANFLANASSGVPYNLYRVTPLQALVNFTTRKNIIAELHIGMASQSIDGFTAGEAFAPSGASGCVMRIARDGFNVNPCWAQLPGESDLGGSSLFFEDILNNTSYRVLVGTPNGRLFRIREVGTPIKILDIPGTWIDGITTVPNNPQVYGPLAGKVVAGDERNPYLYVVDQSSLNKYTIISLWFDLPNGKTSLFKAENMLCIPSSADLLVADYRNAQVIRVPAYQWTALAGRLLVISEDPVLAYNPADNQNHFTNFLTVRWAGNAFSVEPLFAFDALGTYDSLLEQAIFVPVNVK